MTAGTSGGGGTGSTVASASKNRADVRAQVEELVVAVAVLALGIVMVVGALGFDGGAGYQVVGPGVFPMIVGVLGLVCGAVLTVTRTRLLVSGLGASSVEASRGRGTGTSRLGGPDGTDAEDKGESETIREPIGWRGVSLLAGLLIAYAVLLVPVGFWQLTGIVFALAAKIFGGKRFVRNLIIGYVLALAVYFLFDRVLGVGLPDGYIRIAG